ncbi:phosphatase PAP2 family protein [Bacillus salacetis]|uniref:Phosphatase PAP2 family protein n=1 Tax=Bacillus salacetis TaxID=2315464 RepID=A0A3A1QP41_9BACI|nr:vanadium-dependent haloperoxidase [Bacillus salacetis]RIW28836.1 phosphatase PAP2 family protein [Bacillus salacetis]
MQKPYLLWSEVPYAGEARPPDDPVTPDAGSWPLVYLKRRPDGEIVTPGGKRLKLAIKSPYDIDFERELKTVKETLNSLSPEQKKIAVYYGTGVPTKQWTPVIDRLIDSYNVSPTAAAFILAVVHGAASDAMVVTWRLKYEWDVARPNQYDQTLETFICTPRFPTYPSGHAVLSGCTEVVLSYFFPKESHKLRKIAEDDALSRLYGGVHFPSDNNEGLKLGRTVGRAVINMIQKQPGISRDMVSRSYRNANLFPDRYRQFIPYEFPGECSSLILSDGKNKSTLQNLDAPKPFLKRQY